MNSDYQPDAVLKRVRNLKVGMRSTNWGEIREIREQDGTGYYDVRYANGYFAQPWDSLVQVEVPE